MFKDGERVSNKIDKIHGVHKRGVWQYDMNDAFEMADVEDLKPSQQNEAQEVAAATEEEEKGESAEENEKEKEEN